MPAKWVYTENPAQGDNRGNQGVQEGFLKILKGETKSFFKKRVGAEELKTPSEKMAFIKKEFIVWRPSRRVSSQARLAA